MNIGDYVFVPHATSWVWESTLTQIEDETEKYYICDVLVDEFGSREGLVHRKIGFDKEHVYENKKDCDEYIKSYYYDGLCKGCEYENVETNWDCNDCLYKGIVKNQDVTKHDTYICRKCDVVIGGTYTGRHEICKYYNPTLPQNVTNYISWDMYNDILKNCEYNRECIYHKNSCHKTCSYDKYMNEYIRIPCDFVYEGYEGRGVESYLIKRSEWVNLDFKDKDGFYCWGLRFKPLYNKNRTIKKGTANQGIMFDKKTYIKCT